MWEPGKRVVIRDKDGNDSAVGTVESITENDQQKVRVKTDQGVQEVSSDNLVEHLED